MSSIKHVELKDRLSFWRFGRSTAAYLGPPPGQVHFLRGFFPTPAPPAVLELLQLPHLAFCHLQGGGLCHSEDMTERRLSAMDALLRQPITFKGRQKQGRFPPAAA